MMRGNRLRMSRIPRCSADLEGALAALAMERDTAVAKLEAEYMAKREALMAKYAADSPAEDLE